MTNAVENLVVFAPLVLILNAIDYSSSWTALACAVYFWARVAHLIVYTMGLPVFRTLAFVVRLPRAGGTGAGDFQNPLIAGIARSCRSVENCAALLQTSSCASVFHISFLRTMRCSMVAGSPSKLLISLVSVATESQAPA